MEKLDDLPDIQYYPTDDHHKLTNVFTTGFVDAGTVLQAPGEAKDNIYLNTSIFSLIQSLKLIGSSFNTARMTSFT